MLNLLFHSSVVAMGLGSLIPFLIPNSGKHAKRAALALSIISSLLMILLSSSILYTNSSISFAYMQPSSPLSLEFFVDRLAAFFIFTISLVSLAVCIYSFGYAEHYKSRIKMNILVGTLNIFILSMILVVASNNMISFLFFWELMAVSSFILVSFDYEKKETRKAGLFYFIMTQLSTLFLIAAFSIVYGATGSFSISRIGNVPPFLSAILFLCIFLGFGIKAGIVPFHKWLPYAHPAAPSNTSALMSGIMIKVAIYGLIRFVIFVLPHQEIWWGALILIFGAVSAVLGVVYALKEHDIKRLLAYHSIENIGIILMGIGLYVIFSANNLPNFALIGLAGALFHTLNHAIFKSLLFLTAGSVVNATGTKNIEEMGGIIKKMPATAVLFLIGALAISALPPLNGFVSELMIFQAFFNSYLIGNAFMQMLLIAGMSAFALTSALAAACFVKAFGIVFLAIPRTRKAEEAKEAHFSMLIGPGILALCCIFLGVFSLQIFHSFGYQFPLPNLLIIGSALVASYGLTAIVMLNFGKKSRISETWGCGFPLSNGKTEYTASGFSEPITSIFKPIYRPRKEIHKTYYDKSQAIFSEGNVEMDLVKFFEEYLYNPIIKFVDFISRWVSRLQTGYLDDYLSYVFVTCLLLIIIMGFFI